MPARCSKRSSPDPPRRRSGPGGRRHRRGPVRVRCRGRLRCHGTQPVSRSVRLRRGDRPAPLPTDVRHHLRRSRPGRRPRSTGRRWAALGPGRSGVHRHRAAGHGPQPHPVLPPGRHRAAGPAGRERLGVRVHRGGDGALRRLPRAAVDVALALGLDKPEGWRVAPGKAGIDNLEDGIVVPFTHFALLASRYQHAVRRDRRTARQGGGQEPRQRRPQSLRPAPEGPHARRDPRRPDLGPVHPAPVLPGGRGRRSGDPRRRPTRSSGSGSTRPAAPALWGR